MHEVWDNWVKFIMASGITTTGFGFFGFNEVLALSGFFVVLATFFVNWRYKRKSYVLDRERFEFEKTQHNRFDG